MLRADAPVARARALQQKYIVAVEMRADTAAGRGIAHHQIIQPRMRNERKMLQQLRCFGNKLLDTLHQ